MSRKRSCAQLLILVMFFLTCPRVFSKGDCYPEKSTAATAIAELTANNVVANADSRRATQQLPSMIFYVIADALGLDTDLGMSLETYQFLGETARTDKQVGASAKAEGSTSLTEKPGFAQLLGFAVEHGAIKQTVDGTTLTLSTSPYAFIALANRRDTIGLYEQAGFLKRIGMSASFNISDEEMVLANASRRQLTEWSVRARLTGDRSSRSRAFREFWVRDIQPILQNRLNAQNSAINQVLGTGKIATVLASASVALISTVEAHRAAHPDDVDGIKEVILCHLKTNVYDVIQAAPESERIALREVINPVLSKIVAAQERVKEAEDKFKAFLESLGTKPLSTLAYTNHRVATGSDYSEVKFLYEMKAAPLKLTANAAASFYHNPNRMMNQEGVRDFNFSLSLEGEAKNPFARVNDLSKLTYSFSGSYQRMKENEGMMGRQPDIGNAQFRVEFPVASGFSIPVAYTYATATEMSNKKENRFNVGLRLDLDKLYALARLNRR